MMKFMRHGFFSFVFLAMLVLAGFSLVLTDWTGSFRSGVGSSDIAKLNGERISQVEFARLVDRTLRAENIKPEQAFQMGLIDQILTTEMWQRMLARAGYGYGIAIDNATLLTYLQKLAAPIAAQEKANPADVIKRFIAAQGLSEDAFLATMRREMTNNLIRDVVGGGANTSPLMTRALYAGAEQTRDIDYVVLMDDDVSGIAPPDAQALETYYMQRSREFMIPERRDFRVATLSRPQLMAGLKVDDAEITAFYNEHKDQMVRPEMRNVALATYASKEDAQKLIDAAKDVKGAEAFIALAKKTGKPTRTDTRDFAADKTLPGDLQILASAKASDVVGPIQTPLGWIAARVNNITAGGPETLENARTKITEAMQSDKLGAILDARLEALDQAHESRTAFDDVVKANEMNVIDFADLTREGKNVDDQDAFKDHGAIKANVLTTAFTMTDTGRVSPPIEFGNGDIGVVIVDKVEVSKPKELAAVRDTLVQDWMTAERKKANVMGIQSILPDLVAGKISVADAAKTKGRSVETLHGATRDATSALPVGFDQAAWVRLFDAEVGKPILQTLPKGVLLAVVKSATLADPTKANAEKLTSVTADTARAMREEQIVQFLGALNDRYNAKVNQRLLQQMYAPKAE